MIIRHFMISMILVLCNLASCRYAAAFIMSRGKVTVIEKVNVERYSVKLKKWQGWAGPPAFHYVLKKRMLWGTIKGRVAKQPVRGDSIRYCAVSFEANKRRTIIIDKCNQTVQKKRKE